MLKLYSCIIKVKFKYYLRKSVDCAWPCFVTICTTITRDYTLLYVFIMIYVGVCAMKSKQPTQWNLSCNQNWSMFYQWTTNLSKFLKRRENPTLVNRERNESSSLTEATSIKGSRATDCTHLDMNCLYSWYQTQMPLINWRNCLTFRLEPH